MARGRRGQRLVLTFTAEHRGGSGPPLVCVHGFTDTWRTWELVLEALERERDVLAPTLPGHAGGPPLGASPATGEVVDGVERAMDEAGFGVVDVVGNSLGGYVALALAARGRARSVVAFAPAGGWAPGDDGHEETLGHFTTMRPLVKAAAPHADALMATPEGRRRATEFTSVNFEHIPQDLLVHQLLGSAACPAAEPLIDCARREGWPLDPERVTCPLRIVWGTEDRLLPWPRAAEGYRAAFPQADWVVLEGVGHCPQLDVPLEATDLILGFSG